MHRGFMITFAASLKRARERVGVSGMLEKLEGARSSARFWALVEGPTSKIRDAQLNETNEVRNGRLSVDDVMIITLSICDGGTC